MSLFSGNWINCLFNVFVGDVNRGIKCTQSKFDNGTKPYGVVDMLEGRDASFTGFLVLTEMQLIFSLVAGIELW